MIKELILSKNKTLLEKDLVTIKGREDSPGRALLYGTTQAFLECFGLNKIAV